MGNQSEETFCATTVSSPLLIPLLRSQEDLSVFDESGDQPISLRRKAQFFMDQKLYGRARQILELLEGLGGRDGPLLITLASLQILDRSLKRARKTLSHIEQDPLYRCQVLLCYAEIERHLGGIQKAISSLEKCDSEGYPQILERISELQVIDNK